jgi:hypothetical protein
LPVDMERLDDIQQPGRVPGEAKRERFLRIAQRRTQQVLNRLRILGNCGNRGAYEYSEEDVEKIFRAIEDELEETRRKFQDRTKTRAPFRL